MPFTAALVGFTPEKAEVGQNLDRIAEIVLQAQGEGAELVLLPETSTSGYFLEGGVLEASLTQEALVEQIWQRLEGKIERPLDVCLGFYQSLGGHLYNAAAYVELSPGGPRLVGVYQKFFLPTYGVFDEERFVSRGRNLGVFDTRLGRVGILICEDVWHGVLPMLTAVNGAQILLVPAASPARGFAGPDIANHDRYRRLFRAISEEHGVFCLNAQLCGFEGGKGFSGGSMAYDPSGAPLIEGPLAEEHLLLVDLDLDLVPIARAASPLLSDLQSAWGDVRRLVEETRF